LYVMNVMVMEDIKIGYEMENMILERNVMYLIVYLVFELVKNVKIVTQVNVQAVKGKVILN
jgi:hypothetical protein